MRFYQISLRTILEVVFVVSVVLAFFYWRNVPHPAETGRYQIQSIENGMVLYIDTKTGEVWRGNATGMNWRQINTPDRNAGAAGVPSNVAPAPGGGGMF
jgi:hypothetical protein